MTIVIISISLIALIIAGPTRDNIKIVAKSFCVYGRKQKRGLERKMNAFTFLCHYTTTDHDLCKLLPITIILVTTNANYQPHKKIQVAQRPFQLYRYKRIYHLLVKQQLFSTATVHIDTFYSSLHFTLWIMIICIKTQLWYNCCIVINGYLPY